MVKAESIDSRKSREMMQSFKDSDHQRCGNDIYDKGLPKLIGCPEKTAHKDYIE